MKLGRRPAWKCHTNIGVLETTPKGDVFTASRHAFPQTILGQCAVYLHNLHLCLKHGMVKCSFNAVFLAGLCADSSIAQLAAIYVDDVHKTSVWKLIFLIEPLLSSSTHERDL